MMSLIKTDKSNKLPNDTARPRAHNDLIGAIHQQGKIVVRNRYEPKNGEFQTTIPPQLGEKLCQLRTTKTQKLINNKRVRRTTSKKNNRVNSNWQPLISNKFLSIIITIATIMIQMAFMTRSLAQDTISRNYPSSGHDVSSSQKHAKNYTDLIKFESIRNNNFNADNQAPAIQKNNATDKHAIMLDNGLDRMDNVNDSDDEDYINGDPTNVTPTTPTQPDQKVTTATSSSANIYYPQQVNRTAAHSGARLLHLNVDDVQLNVAESEKHNHQEMNSECALILKRTYILNSNSDEWGDKFVFNDQDPEEKQAQVHKSDLCIKHSDVDKAIEEAKHKIKFEQPEDLDSFEISEKSISSVAELSLATGQLLAKKFDLSHDEILNALPMIDMSSSKFSCPRHVSPMMCMKTAYRTITGHCNNLKHPSWGAAKTPYSRYLPPDYADGIDLPRASRNGDRLPSARLISMIVHPDIENPSNDHSAAFASWGQLLNHDVTRAALGSAPECCPAYLKGPCMPIPVPPDDDFYGRFNIKCLKFDRTPAAIRPKCLLGLRAQINTVTAPVDASIVYGSSKSRAHMLRTFQDGKMRVWNFFEHQNLKPLLPPKTEKPDEECLGRPKKLFCFEAGDVRANEQTHLTVLHTIYVREHNRIASYLAKMNLDWDDEKIYQEARRIIYACEQHVVVNEFLPLLLGPRFMQEYAIGATNDGDHWPGYDPSVTTSTGTGFAAAAFRYGHSMVDGLIKRLSPQGQLIEAEKLRNLFKRPFLLYEPGAVDQLILGMVWTPAEQTDPFVTEELSGHLFQPPKAKFGHDLAAINIQRGRDQGVPGYNDWREWCGLSRARSFSDLEPLLTNKTVYHYSRIYKHVDDIDLWSAGISERKLRGAAVGPTMACIIARQFMNTKRGDRFWYENPDQPSSFTKAQLKEIKKITLAKILCTNSDHIQHIQPMVMRLPHPIYNAKVACDSLPTINLKLWDSNSLDNF